MTLARALHRSAVLHALRAGLIASALVPTAFAAPQVWGKQVGSGAGEWLHGVAADGSGGTFECGRTRGDLGGAQLGLGDAFVTRRDGSGNVLWSSKMATANVDEGRGVAADGLGGVYLAGNRDGVANPQTLKNYEAFVARFDAAGNLIWHRAVGVAEWEELNSCAPDGSGGVFVAGRSFQDENAAIFGDGDIWLSRFDASGNQLWIQRFGSAAGDICTRVEHDGGGGALICGWTFGSLGGPLQGISDAWVAHYDGAGNRQWVHQLGSAVSVYPSSSFLPNTFAGGLAADGAGGCYVTGGTTAQLVQGASVRQRAFLMRLDAQGNSLWLEQFGDTGGELGWDLAPDAQGGVYLAGLTHGNYVVTSAGHDDVWIRRVDASGSFLPALQFGSKNQESVSEIALVGAGVVVVGDTVGYDELFGVPAIYQNGYVALFDACEFGAESNYCSSIANSTGWPSKLGSTGSAYVSNNDFGLLANFVPEQEPGVFLMGTATNQMPFGNGTLCVGGAVSRLAVDEVQFNVVETHLDVSDLNSPASQISAGSTWHFQFWFRDTAGGGAGFNLSNGLSVTFCP